MIPSEPLPVTKQLALHLEDPDDELTLPPDIAARVQKSLDDGVVLRPRALREFPHVTAAIIWRPGLPNELVQAIIDYCDRPMELELDGHRFAIAPVPPGTARLVQAREAPLPEQEGQAG